MKAITLDQLIASLNDLRRTHGGGTTVICGTDWTDESWTPDPDFVDGQVRL